MERGTRHLASIVTVVFALGILYFLLIVTTFRNYHLDGDPHYSHRHWTSPYGSPTRLPGVPLSAAADKGQSDGDRADAWPF